MMIQVILGLILFTCCGLKAEYVKLKSIDADKGKVVLKEGQLVELTCEVTSGCSAFADDDTAEIRYTFEVDRMEVQNSTNNSFIVEYPAIDTIHHHHVLLGGSYICTVENSTDVLGESNSLDIYFAPSITRGLTDSIYVTNGSSVQLHCSVTTYPVTNLSIEWLRSSSSITNLSAIIEDIDIDQFSLSLPLFSTISITNVSDQAIVSNLVIDPVQFEDHGDYVCLAILNIDNITFTAEAKIASITVSPNNSVSVFPAYVISSSGSSANFTCLAEVNANSSIYIWTRHDGNIIDQFIHTTPIDVNGILTSISDLIIANGSTLSIDPVDPTEDGGMYYCHVLNDAGAGIDRAELYISPVVTLSPEYVLAEDGDNVTLLCLADSYLPPHYQWQMRNITTNIFETLPYTTGPQLLLNNVSYSDYGEYRCIATIDVKHADNAADLISVSDTATITVSPFGSISLSTLHVDVPRLTNTSVTCSAQGGPNTQLYWVRDSIASVNTSNLPLSLNSVVSNNSLLTIDSADGSLGGVYTCVAFNDAGFDNESVSVYVLPEILQNPDDVYTEPNERVELTCSADSFPPPEYQWQLLNETTFETIDGEINSSLVFDPVDFYDFGTYRCVVTTPIETAVSEEATITVSPIVYATPHQIGSHGDNLIFGCSAMGGPGNTFHWVKGTEQIGSLNDSSSPINVSMTLDSLLYVESTSAELVITLKDLSAQTQGGDYTCIVINEAGYDNVTITLYILPKVIEHPMDQFVNNGDTATTLTCKGDSFPAPRYQWERWNASIEVYVPLIGETNSSLVFNTIEYEDYGRYRCMVITDIIDQNVTSDSALITVSPRDSVTIDPQIENSFNGSSVTLSCLARGGPDNTFQWTYLWTGDVVSNSYQYMFIADIYTGGEYQCTVTNEAGNGTDNAIVNVGPIITVDPNSFNVTIIEQNITLTCTAIGVPEPSITWTHNNSVLNEDGDEVASEDGLTIELFDESVGSVSSRLVIDSALANHTGEYYCNATSSIDFYDTVMSDIALVLVQDIPDPPENLTAIKITSRNVTLTWEEPHDNNAPILNYIVLYTDPAFLGNLTQTVSTQGDKETLQITGLHPGQYYDFTVTATNEEGESEESQPLTVRTLEEVPFGFPQNLSATTLNSTTIAVSWEPVIENEANGVITQYRIIGVPSEDFADTVDITVTDSAVLSVIASGLEEFVEYYFTIRARTVVGFGPISPDVTAKTDQDEPSGFPQNLTAVTINSTVIEISWDEVLESKANGIITQYNITGVPDAPFASIVNMVVDDTVFMVEFFDLEEFVDYRFTISASTEVGFGPNSPETIARTDEDEPSGFPQNFNATTINSTAIEVSWDEVLEDEANGIITQYRIIGLPSEDFTNTVNITVNNSTVFSVNASGLEEFVSYTFTIRARTVVGFGPNSPSATARTDQDEPSGFPQNLTAITLNSTAIEVSWDEVLENETNGIITQYNITGVPDAPFASGVVNMVVDDTVFMVVLGDLEEFVVYRFTISASTEIGFGPTSPEVAARTDEDEPSGFPQNFNATTINSTAIEVSWERVLKNEANGEITQYKIVGVPNEDFADTVDISLTDSAVLSTVVNGLHEFVEYNFTISASTMVGFGPGSPEVTATTNQDEPSGFPQNLTAITLNSTAIEVSWDEVLEDEANGIITQYNITGVPNAPFASIVNMVVDDTVFMVVFTDLEEFVVYRFTISANTEVGFGPNSSEVTTRTDEAVPVAAPQDFTVTNTTANSISLQWAPPVARDINGIIRGYNIRYRIIQQLGVDEIDINNETLVMNITGNTTLCAVLTDLDNYTVYTVSVTAVTIGEGAMATLTQRTDENAPESPPIFINAIADSSTSVNVSWGAPPLNLINGIIDYYEIHYGRHNSEAIIYTVEGNTTLEVEITELEEFVEYWFQVRAVTVAPGPFTAFTNAITFQAPPYVAVMINDSTAVPEETREATSVRLTWDPIPPDEANGELSYNVAISVRGLDNNGRSKRQLESNSLDVCLQAANITPVFSHLVPGDRTSLLLKDIAPNTRYSYTVTGVTDAGTGLPSSPVNFSTLEGVPTAPQSVMLTNTSSTSLQLEWVQPLCDNGRRIGYRVTYDPLPGPNPIGEFGNEDSVLNSTNVTATSQKLTGLTPNSPYQVIICALTSTGCGVNVTINQTTSEDAPQSVRGLSVNNVTSVADLIVSWVSPSSRNGSFNISLSFTASPVFMYGNRTQVDNGQMNLFGFENELSNVTIHDVLPYAEYTVSITAFNRLYGMKSSSEAKMVSTVSQPTESSEVTNATAIALTYSSVLVTWDVPHYPNGPITYYNICFIPYQTSCGRAESDSSIFVFNGLNSLHEYEVTIQPVTVFNNQLLIGVLSKPLQVTTNSTDPFMAVDYDAMIEEEGVGLVRLTLPNHREFTVGDSIIFYGVLVVSNETCTTVSDYGYHYPTPQPFSITNSNGYYITGAWSNTSLIPDEYIIGDSGSTTALDTSIGQHPMMYTNTELNTGSPYCFLLVIHYDSGVRNLPIVRYVYLGSITTRSDDASSNIMIYIIIGAAVLCSVCLILTIVLTSAIVCMCYKRSSKSMKYTIEGKTNALNNSNDKTTETGRPLSELITVDALIKSMADSPADEDHAFFDPSIRIHNPIIAKHFQAHVAKMHMNDDYHFSMEFPSLEPHHVPKAEASLHPKNKAKNRYTNISAYDHTRVKLYNGTSSSGSDYINANFINGFQTPDKYIATQGPSVQTISDFWRMVWDQESAIIVMLTNLEENGRKKCHLYWPTMEERLKTYGPIVVFIEQEVELPDHTIRTFILKYGNSKERTVKQFHYTGWPDFGVPDSPTSVIRFIRKIDSNDQSFDGPIIVHCSAGVGRTGTFITISSQMERLEETKTVDIFNFIRNMRHQRCLMVQSVEQYVFIHDAILEVIECGNTEVSSKDLQQHYNKICAFTYTGGLKLQTEFNHIKETIHVSPSTYAGSLPCNALKNRFFNILPYDNHRCKLVSQPNIDGSDYINASIIPGYHKNRVYIAAQAPLKYTVVDFWRMIWERRSLTIVMFSDEDEESQEMSYIYWPEYGSGSDVQGFVVIDTVCVVEFPNYTLRQFKLTHCKTEDTLHVKQFHYKNWPAKGACGLPSAILDMREQVEEWQEVSLNQISDKPIVVHCSDGSCRSGAYIAICNLIDRLNKEGMVDVFQTVRGIRILRQRMVYYVDQYDFIYKVLVEFAASLH